MPALLFILFFVLLSSSLLYGQNADSLKSLLKSSKGERKVELLLTLSSHYKNSNSALLSKYSSEAYTLARMLSYQKGEADALRYIGLSLFNTGHYSRSIDTLLIAEKLFRELNNDFGYGSVKKQIGDAYMRIADYGNSFKYYLESLEILEKHTKKQMNFDTQALLAALYNSMGLLNRQIGNRKEAQDYFLKSLNIDTRIKNTNGMVATNINLGLLKHDNDEYDSAIVYFTKAYELAKSSQNSRLLSTAANNLGEAYFLKGDFQQAINYLLEAYSIYKSFEDKNSILRTVFIIGQIYSRTGDYDAALNNFELAKTLAEEIGVKKELINIYSELANINEKLGKPDKVIEYMRMYDSVKDSVFDLEKSRQLTELELKYGIDNKEKLNRIQELKLKEQDILIYSTLSGLFLLSMLTLVIYSRYIIRKKANTIIAEQKEKILENNRLLEEKNYKIYSQNQKLIELNATKDKFFSIIAHDLKSPLSVTISISDFLKSNIDKISTEEVNDLIEKMHQSGINLLNLLENLLEWSRLQTGRMEYNPNILNLNNVVFESIFILNRNAEEKSIEIRNEISNDIEVFADQYMLEVILRNLISNAIKFTQEDGKVWINADTNNSHITISVNDSGIGIPHELIGKLFKIEEAITTSGTHNEKGTGIGLILCKEFVEKHNGKIWVESRVNNGTSMKFTLPVRTD